jgi:hypothetical protein
MPKSFVRQNTILLGKVLDRFGVPFQTHYGFDESHDKYMGAGDRGHYGYPNFPEDRNVGGAFSYRDVSIQNDIIDVTGIHTGRFGTTINYTYDGSLQVVGSSAPVVTGELTGADWGPEAYAKMKPTKPEFDLGVSLGELKDAPSMLKMRFENFLQTGGSSALAYQFGWKPLLQDAVNLYYSQRFIEKRLKQLLRDNGRPVRRNIELLEKTQSGHTRTEGESYGSFTPVLSTYFYRSQPKFTTDTWFEDRVWASARFRYFLPGGPRDVKWKKRLLRELFGFKADPLTIYNLMPWSWLLDWFTNIGYVVDNCTVDIADRLAASHFYVMRTRSGNARTQVRGEFRLKNGTPVNISGSSNHQRIHKSRVQGGPFEFAFNNESLNGTQLAILGALGLSRL